MAYLTSAALANAWGSRRPGPLGGAGAYKIWRPNRYWIRPPDQFAVPVGGEPALTGDSSATGGVSEKSEPRDIHQSILFEIAQSYEEMPDPIL